VTHPTLKTRPNRCPLLVHANCALGGRPDPPRNPLRRRIVWTLLLALVGCIGGAAGHAEEISREQMQGLDEQVQEIKSDVLGISAELSRLEERLIYPSNTQVALFVSLVEDDAFQLDSVQIQIDGEPVAHHIYTFKELEALQKGGVQRIYTGNLPTGGHRLDVAVVGKSRGGSDVTGTGTFTIEKGVEPKLVDITLAGDASIQLGSW